MSGKRSGTSVRALLAAFVIFTAACSSAEPPTAPDAVPVAPEVAPQPTTSGSVGTFRRTGYSVTGRATLTITNGVAQLDFSDDFTIGSAPGPFVYINTTNNPNTGRPLRVAPLRSGRGAQSYTFQVPAGVQYGWVLIWCDPLNVPMAEAAIPLTP